MSEEELGNLLAAIGNHELKALTLGVMREGTIYKREDIYRKLLEIQGRPYIWKTGKELVIKYCAKTLSPIGLVTTREIINPNLSTYGYMITPYGEIIGKSLTGHLLGFSLRYPAFSSIEAMGATVSWSEVKRIQTIDGGEAEFRKRAPVVRLKIFRQLVSSVLPIRAADLARAIGEKQGIVQNHLQTLSRLSIIEYKATEPNKPYSFYKLSPQRPNREPRPYPKKPTITKRVLEIFLSNPEFSGSPAMVAEKLKELYPEYQALKQLTMQMMTNNILSHLEKEGFLAHEGFRYNIQSEINITDGNRAMLRELLGIVDRFKSGDEDFRKEGGAKLEKIINNPSLVRVLVAKARTTSPHASQTREQELVEIFSFLLQRYPNSTSRELQRYLEEYDKRLELGRTYRILHSHKDQFKPTRRGRVIYWSVRSNQSYASASTP